MAPTETLASGSVPFLFQPDQIESMIKLGEKNAYDVIHKGEGVAWREMKEKREEEKLRRFTRVSNKQLKFMK